MMMIRPSPSLPLGESWIHSVLRSLSAGLIVTDSAGTVLFANARACELLAQGEYQIIGKNLRHVLGPLETFLASSTQGRIETEVQLENGRTLAVGATFSPISGTGRAGDAEQYVCLFQDISQMRELREERDRLLQLATVNTILPSILHELRNPLAAVESMIEILAEETDGRVQRDLRVVLNEVHRLSLTLQGVGTVGQDLRTSVASSASCALEDVLRVMRGRAERVKVSIESRISVLPPLYFDPTVLRGILFNLVDNSIRASRAGDRIRVSARVDDARGCFELVVEDEGTGMTPEVAARCTELFFTTRPHGSGLGLALVHRTVEAAGGTIQFESRVGQGTRVTILIPMFVTQPSEVGN